MLAYIGRVEMGHKVTGSLNWCDLGIVWPAKDRTLTDICPKAIPHSFVATQIGPRFKIIYHTDTRMLTVNLFNQYLIFEILNM